MPGMTNKILLRHPPNRQRSTAHRRIAHAIQVSLHRGASCAKLPHFRYHCPVNVLTVIAHPNPDSFNYAIVERVEAGLKSAGHEVRRRDLYHPLFDPVLGADELAALQQGEVCAAVREEQALLDWAEALVFVYPLWWLDRPAVLKGWCDRVLTHGFAFSYDENGVRGLLPQKRALVLVTAGGSGVEMEEMGATTAQILFPMVEGSLKFCGVDEVEGRVFYAVGSASDQERAAMLDAVEQLGRTMVA